MGTVLMASVSEATLVEKVSRPSFRSSRPSPDARPVQTNGRRRASSRMSVWTSRRVSSSTAGSRKFRTWPVAASVRPGPSTESRLIVTFSPCPERRTLSAPIAVRPRRGDE